MLILFRDTNGDVQSVEIAGRDEITIMVDGVTYEVEQTYRRAGSIRVSLKSRNVNGLVVLPRYANQVDISAEERDDARADLRERELAQRLGEMQP